MALGASSSFTLRARVNVGSGNITNGAVVQAGTAPDTRPNNNNAEVTTAVIPGADLRLAKAVSANPAVAA